MQDILVFIKDKSIDLSDMGVKNFALLKNDALELLIKFEKNSILIYGGDFLVKKSGSMHYDYMNWSTEGKDFKNNLAYAKRFIEKYAKIDTYIEFVTDIDLYNMAELEIG